MGHSRARNPGIIPFRLLRTDHNTAVHWATAFFFLAISHHNDDMFCVASAQADVEAKHKQFSTFKTDSHFQCFRRSTTCKVRLSIVSSLCRHTTPSFSLGEYIGLTNREELLRVAIRSFSPESRSKRNEGRNIWRISALGRHPSTVHPRLLPTLKYSFCKISHTRFCIQKQLGHLPDILQFNLVSADQLH
jgi:hypothetical protein